jgi:hypothetical protein
MTPHSTRLSTLCLSYRHCTIHTAVGSPLSVVGQGTLCSNSFHVPDVSLVPDLTMQLMLAGQITDHDYCVILVPDCCYIQDFVARVICLVLAPGVVTHNVFGSSTSFVFLPLRPPVLPDLSSLLRPRRHFLSGIIVWVIFVVLDYLLYFVEVF